MFRKGGLQNQRSPSSRHKKPKPHSPLKSLENRSHVGGDMTDFCNMVGQQHDQDGLQVDIQSSNRFGESYDVHGELGRGKFAVVKKCKHKDNGKDFAAKFQRKRRKGKDCRKEIIQEVKMLELDHPYLVQLIEVFESSHEMIIITEYAAGGELFQHIMMEEGFEEKEVIRLLRQILTGLLYMHERDIVHLDVKPQNILLTAEPPRGSIKLCDFGFARTIKTKDEVRDIIGTPDYVAPEVLNYEPLHTSCDMWSVGVLAYVMLTGCSPFAGDSKMETFSNITQLNYDFPDELFESISQHALDFMKKLLKKDPEDRMTALQSLKHPWLYDEKQKLAHPISPTKSPFGSPLGCRRTLTPSPGEIIETEEPMKKCKCAVDSSGDELDKEEVNSEVNRTVGDNNTTFYPPSDSDQCMCSSTDDLDDILSSNEILNECHPPGNLHVNSHEKVVLDKHEDDDRITVKSCDNMLVNNDLEEETGGINDILGLQTDTFAVQESYGPADVINTSSHQHNNINSVCDNIEFIQPNCQRTEIVTGNGSESCYFMYHDNKPELLILKTDGHNHEDDDRNHQHINDDHLRHDDLSNSHSSIEADDDDDDDDEDEYIDNGDKIVVDNCKTLHGNTSGVSYFPVVTSSQNCSQYNMCSSNNIIRNDHDYDLVNGNNGGDNQSVITLITENDDVDSINETDC